MNSPGSEPRVNEASANLTKFKDIAVRYRDDADFRAAMDGGDIQETVDYLGIDVPEGMTAQFHFDTPDVIHVALPPDPSEMLHDESLAAIAGGKTAGSAGTVGSASTMACTSVPSSVSSAGTAGTVGCATSGSAT